MNTRFSGINKVHNIFIKYKYLLPKAELKWLFICKLSQILHSALVQKVKSEESLYSKHIHIFWLGGYFCQTALECD